MAQPIKVDLPHKLGSEEARRRIANNIHKLRDHIPGGAARSNRAGPATTRFGDPSLGQAVQAKIGVEETKVRVEFHAAGDAGLFAGPIEAMLQKKGNVPLLEDKQQEATCFPFASSAR